MNAAQLHRLTRNELRIRLTAAESVILAAERLRPAAPLSARVVKAIGDRLEILGEIYRRDRELTARLERMK